MTGAPAASWTCRRGPVLGLWAAALAGGSSAGGSSSACGGSAACASGAWLVVVSAAVAGAGEGASTTGVWEGVEGACTVAEGAGDLGLGGVGVKGLAGAGAATGRGGGSGIQTASSTFGVPAEDWTGVAGPIQGLNSSAQCAAATSAVIPTTRRFDMVVSIQGLVPAQGQGPKRQADGRHPNALRRKCRNAPEAHIPCKPARANASNESTCPHGQRQQQAQCLGGYLPSSRL